MSGRSTAKFWSRWTIALLLLAGVTTLSSAAYNPTQTLTVDPQAASDEDDDGDHLFRSLGAALDLQNASHAQPNDTIVLKAGTYEEDVTIDVPGLTVRSESGKAKTRLVGRVVVQAKQVTLQGLSVEATGRAYGITVNAPEVRLIAVRVFGAMTAGVGLFHARSATLEQLQLDDNALGLEVSDADGLKVTSSHFQANEGAGAELDGLASASLTDNRFSLNGGAGLRVHQMTGSRLQGNTFEHNASFGLRVARSAHNEVLNSRFSDNGQYGAVVEDSVQTQFVNNRFFDNGGKRAPSGGLLLYNAQDNRIEANTFRGHSDRNAAGLRLLGGASANRVLNNAFDGNGVGITLEQDEGGIPGANDISDNHISASHGAGILSQGRNDRLANNVLEGNNGPGISLNNSRGERLEHNTLFGNGKAGIYAQDSRQLWLAYNVLYDNAYGVQVQRVHEGTLQDNLVRDNHAQGVRIVESEGWKLLDNRILHNREDGLWLENVTQLSLSRNTFARNLKNGVQLENVVDADLNHNAFEQNNGGLAAWGGRHIVAQFNDFVDNVAFGLWSMRTTGLDARYNFWGGAQGPNGISPSHTFTNDVVKEVPLEALFPWLPQRTAGLNDPAIKGWFFTQPPDAKLYQAAQVHVAFGFSGLEVHNGWLSVMSQPTPPEGAPTLGEDYQLFDTFTGGQLLGQVELIVPYDLKALSAQTPLDDLGLFLWDGTRWHTLPSTLDEENHALRSMVNVDQLKRATVALAWSQQRKLTSSNWLLDPPTWVVGERFEARLRDPDKNVRPERPDRLLGAIELLDDAGQTLLTLDARESTAASGEFVVQWPTTMAEILAEQRSLRLRYTDPEAPQDASEAEIDVVTRTPFILDPNAPASEDTDHNFRFRTWAALFQNSPRPKPGETITLLPGNYSGAWFVNTPGLHIEAQPGAILHGSLTLGSDHITLSGLELESDEAVALSVKGNAISIDGIDVRARHRAVLVEGQGLVMEHARITAQQTALTLNGQQTKITHNAIIGTPALDVGRVHSALEHNWWGSPDGPGENVQIRQEDVFPWLLTPPVGSFEVADVAGTEWHRANSVWDNVSELNRAFSTLDFRLAWQALQQFFVPREIDFSIAEGWSLRVGTQRAGRAIVERKSNRSQTNFPPRTTTFGLWLSHPQGTTLTLEYRGMRPPQAWIARGTAWVKLPVKVLGQQRMSVRFPRPLSNSTLPLWLALSEP